MKRTIIPFLTILLCASLFAGLSTAQPFFERKQFITGNDTLPYRLAYPAHYDPARSYPLVVFLHGSGDRGRDNEQPLAHLPAVFTDSLNRELHPCFLLVPQCAAGAAWADFPDFPRSLKGSLAPTRPAAMTLQLVERLSTQLDIDTDRRYITGYSMGGEGTFDLIARRPDLFAAAVPVCPVADTATADRIAEVHLWMFHGGADSVNPAIYSRLIYSQLRQFSTRVTYTEYPGIGHASWNLAYSEKRLLPWLFSRLRTTAINIDHKTVLTRQDTLRGTVTPERAWWDVLRYDLTFRPDFEAKTLRGSNTIRYRVLRKEARPVMQIDLQPPLRIDSIGWNGRPQLSFRRDGNAWFVQLPAQEAGSHHALTVFYSGRPHTAADPPGNGGFTWTVDSLGRPWMATSCQGVGASTWYPCKDHQGDEPDSGVLIRVIVPDTLVAISNGRLLQKQNSEKGWMDYLWQTAAPVNSYSAGIYIGKYVAIHETYDGVSGPLSTEYWVLDYNMARAKAHLIPESRKVLGSYEKWMGPYPFYRDGFKIVEAPYIGMEHQSAVAYGNNFGFGYRGRDISRTGWGLKYDIILTHEVAHEWFGNNITTADMADKWVHEGFAGYAEILYLQDQFGMEAGNAYAIAKRANILNERPVIPRYGVNETDGADNYAKGRAVIHMIRQIIVNDSLFRKLLIGMNGEFGRTVTTGAVVEAYISRATGIDFAPVFDQYLRTVQVPVLVYQLRDGVLRYRYRNCNPGFAMPLRVTIGGAMRWLRPTAAWQELREAGLSGTDGVVVDPNFYVEVERVGEK